MADQRPSAVDIETPNAARIYDYILDGKDNFAADREAAKQLLAAFPEAREAARVGRDFLGEVVAYLVGEAGIRQFLDIGSGLPTRKNVHEVAQGIAPDAKVVYVDYDPIVCTHGRALLESGDRVAMVEADLREPERILTDPATRRLIDFTEPVAVLLMSVLHFVEDAADPLAVVARLRAELVPGSCMVITQLVETDQRKTDVADVKKLYAHSSSPIFPRSREKVMQFLGGLELLEIERFVSPEIVNRFSVIGWGGVGIKR